MRELQPAEYHRCKGGTYRPCTIRRVFVRGGKRCIVANIDGFNRIVSADLVIPKRK